MQMHPAPLARAQSIRPFSIAFVVPFLKFAIFFASTAVEGESEAFAPVIPWYRGLRARRADARGSARRPRQGGRRSGPCARSRTSARAPHHQAGG